MAESWSNCEVVAERERASTSPLPLGSKFTSRGDFVESPIEVTLNAEFFQWDSSNFPEIWSELRPAEEGESGEGLGGLSSQGERGPSNSLEDSPVKASSEEEELSSEV